MGEGLEAALILTQSFWGRLWFILCCCRSDEIQVENGNARRKMHSAVVTSEKGKSAIEALTRTETEVTYVAVKTIGYRSSNASHTAIH